MRLLQRVYSYICNTIKCLCCDWIGVTSTSSVYMMILGVGKTWMVSSGQKQWRMEYTCMGQNLLLEESGFRSIMVRTWATNPTYWKPHISFHQVLDLRAISHSIIISFSLGVSQIPRTIKTLLGFAAKMGQFRG